MTEKKRILLVFSTAGMGHKKAALALEGVMKGMPERCEVKTVDIMEYANRFYRFLYLDLYVFMMKKATWLWAIMFYVSDLRLFDVLTRRLRAKMDHSGVPGFGEFLLKESPDVVIATHFLVPSIAGILKRTGLKSKLAAVVTDYGPHSYWLSAGIDMYFAGSDRVRTELERKGIRPGKTFVTGIPTTEEFHRKHDEDVIRKRYGLEETRKTIFIMSGGFGVGPVGKMLEEMMSCASRIQIIAVSGHNKELYGQLERISASLNYPVKLFGFTDKVAELMAVSDLMITKAGGISVTEAMDSALPMILYGSIPGQETWNERFLQENGAARIAASIKQIPRIADEMLHDPAVYETFKRGLGKICKPHAAEDITNAVMKDAGGEK
ncbi:MAG: glycosyltransferase [Candidatus Omnitrophota bacterium]